jgi:negative modulator of initiation of replication
MKSIIIDDDLYQFIASQTQDIGEDASQILRRLLMPGVPVPKPVSKPGASDADVFELLKGSKLSEMTKKVEQFLTILAALYQAKPQQFDKVLEIKGLNRIYFAVSKEQLLAERSTTNPKQILPSSYWVITNNNTAKKVSILREVATALGYGDADVEKLAVMFAPELVNE